MSLSGSDKKLLESIYQTPPFAPNIYYKSSNPKIFSDDFSNNLLHTAYDEFDHRILKTTQTTIQQPMSQHSQNIIRPSIFNPNNQIRPPNLNPARFQILISPHAPGTNTNTFRNLMEDLPIS
jgi:hypothetical protein